MSFDLQKDADPQELDIHQMDDSQPSAGNVEDRMHKYARFADVVYEPTAVKRKMALEKLMSDDEEDKYEYDSKLSDKYQSVFVDRKSNEVITSVRGTELTDFEDLTSDIAVAFGLEKLGPRYKRAKKSMAKIIEKYPEMKHTLSSHSLGGTINSALLNEYKDKIDRVYNFNPGSSISDVRAAAGLKQSHTDFVKSKKMPPEHVSKISTFTVKGDIVSSGMTPTTAGEYVSIKKPGGNPHSISNFVKAPKSKKRKHDEVEEE